MSEKLYALLLKLYPDDFRRTYGDEAMRLVRERARDEKGFISGPRLWLDLLVDLAISLPREYSARPAVAAEAHPVNGAPSFQLLTEGLPNRALLLLAGMLSAVLLWACVTSVARSRTFPASFADPHSLQWLVQSDLDLARSRPDAYAAAVSEYSFCMNAHRNIPNNSVQPLFMFYFSPPGASGVALIDGKPVQTFMNTQHLMIRADVAAGDHLFVLRLDGTAERTSMWRNNDAAYCTK